MDPDSTSRRTSEVPAIRPLSVKDFDAVVEIDRGIMGRSRRGYMEKRLEAALRDPDAHIQLAAENSGGGLMGYLLARIVEGEFGRSSAAVVLEAIGVEPAEQHAGIGRELLERLEEIMHRKGICELLTQVEWANRPLLGFLACTGFALAPRLVLERSTQPAGEL